MFEEDQETLAAEYVLGTLSAEEREHAEALRSFDPEFDAAVKQWERRDGEHYHDPAENAEVASDFLYVESAGTQPEAAAEEEAETPAGDPEHEVEHHVADHLDPPPFVGAGMGGDYDADIIRLRKRG